MRLRRRSAKPAVAFASFGVSIRVEVDDRALLHEIEPILPPIRAFQANHTGITFALTTGQQGLLSVSVDEVPLIGATAPPVAIGLLDAQIRMHIAATTTEKVFVHAGTVALGERALLLPGASFAGKSTLVAALIRSGASYFSDEFAVLDDDGWVHPYPKPLSIRRDGETNDVPAETIGANVADRPAFVSGVVVTQYRPGSGWAPSELGPGATVLELLQHTVPAQERPAASLRALSRAAEGAWCWRGERGEADELVPILLEALASSRPGPRSSPL